MSHGSTLASLTLSFSVLSSFSSFPSSAVVLGYKIAKYNKQLSANLSRVKSLSQSSVKWPRHGEASSCEPQVLQEEPPSATALAITMLLGLPCT